MKESEFIALLNLYLDHEISAADAARLEAEVQSRPERRKIYEQYCRMQKACKVLATDFQSEESGGDKKVVPFETAAAQRKRSSQFYTVGTVIAAAACAAIIFVGQSRQEAAGEKAFVQAAVVVPSVTPASERVSVVQVFAKTPTSRQLGVRSASLVSDPLLLTHSTTAEAALAAVDTTTSDHLAWINAVQLAPINALTQAEQLRFDVPPTSLRPETRTMRNQRPPTEAAVEMTAFKFQK